MDKGNTPKSDVESNGMPANQSLRSERTSALRADDLFQSAPNVNAHFEASASTNAPVRQSTVVPPPAIKATGLDL
jgi:hypothetical protein